LKVKELIRLLERDMKEYGEDSIVKIAEPQKYAHDVLTVSFDGRDENGKARLILIG